MTEAHKPLFTINEPLDEKAIKVLQALADVCEYTTDTRVHWLRACDPYAIIWIGIEIQAALDARLKEARE